MGFSDYGSDVCTEAMCLMFENFECFVIIDFFTAMKFFLNTMNCFCYLPHFVIFYCSEGFE